MTISAKVIADSVTLKGERLTTIEVEFHRFILPELNTHRVFSRNYQSSRAVPVEALIKQVRDNPAMPVHWGSNQAGMVAQDELAGNSRDLVESEWRNAAIDAANWAELMMEQGLHKQVANRVLEPFMWTKGIITADTEGWESFFKLRCHPAAQPEIQALAYIIRGAYNESDPLPLNDGDWHMPYFGAGAWLLGVDDVSLGNAIKISTSCVAQVSYRRLDDSIEKAKKIYSMLHLPEDGVYHEDPPHFSPAEHVAKCTESENKNSGNFNCTGWYQYRKMLERGTELAHIGE
jgi:hypothetical protein